MQKVALFSLALIALCPSSMPPACAQIFHGPSGLYQITSGTYTMIGGIWGTLTTKLPQTDQAFVLLATDPLNGRVELKFLKDDQQTAFLTLSNGVVSGDLIRFQYLAPHPYPFMDEFGTVDYIVTASPTALQLNGSTEFPPICCDIPWFFSHSNVVATALLPISIRVSEVEIMWTSESNRRYQVQYCLDLRTNLWTDLGPPVTASGPTTSVFDRVHPGQPQRIYRVLAVP